MSKLIKFLISAVVAILVFFIGISIIMAAGIIGIAAMIIPAILAFVAFMASQLVFRIFKFKTLFYVVIVWLVIILIGVGSFSFFA